MGCIEPGVAPQMMDDLLQPGFLLVLRRAPDPAELRALKTSAASLGAQLLCIDAATTAPGVVKLAEADGILAGMARTPWMRGRTARPDHLVYGVACSVEDAGVLDATSFRDIGIQPPIRANPKLPLPERNMSEATFPSCDTERLLLDLEAQRCNAMKRADFARLREILHPGLVHVHAKGQTDSYESYFRSGGTHVDYRQIGTARN